MRKGEKQEKSRRDEELEINKKHQKNFFFLQTTIPNHNNVNSSDNFIFFHGTCRANIVEFMVLRTLKPVRSGMTSSNRFNLSTTNLPLDV